MAERTCTFCTISYEDEKQIVLLKFYSRISESENLSERLPLEFLEIMYWHTSAKFAFPSFIALIGPHCCVHITLSALF